jgi:hypothetical protein
MRQKLARRRGRPPGAKNKPKEPIPLTFARTRELFARCYTPAQQEKLFKQLKPSEVFRLMAMLEPKEKPQSAEREKIVLSMEGMIAKQYCPHCSHCSGGQIVDVSPEAAPAPPVSRSLPVPSARDQALADAAQRERDRVESQEEQRRSPDIIEATNRRLAEEMRQEREEAMNPTPPFTGGVKGC